MNRHDNPAKNMTATPELATNNDVPKSGCFAIKMVGIIINTAAIANCLTLGGKV